LIVCTVDVAVWVLPPNVRLQLEVVSPSADPVFRNVSAQDSGSPEHEAEIVETWGA
jgi:hypothetical protein